MNSKSTVTLKKLVMAALFAALACVATMSIKIPTPGTSGYIHPGDAIVILAGVVLGPAWGFLAGGIGSAMADLLGGYFVYVPITFVIKVKKGNSVFNGIRLMAYLAIAPTAPPSATNIKFIVILSPFVVYIITLLSYSIFYF